MIFKLKYSAFLLTLGALTGYGQWTSIGGDDFDSYTFGSQPGGNWDNTNMSTQNTANQWITDESGGTNEGISVPGNTAGSGNALYYFDEDASQVSKAALDLGGSGENYDIVRVSFDFSFPSTDGTGAFGVIALTNSGNDAIGSAANRAISINMKRDGSLSWSGGASATYSAGTSHNLSIIANGSDTTFDYDALDGSGSTTLASKAFDVYIDDTLIDSSVSFTTDTIDLGRFGITTYTGTVGAEIIIDNLDFSTPSAIPEPSASSLWIGLSALLILVPASRRSRKH